MLSPATKILGRLIEAQGIENHSAVPQSSLKQTIEKGNNFCPRLPALKSVPELFRQFSGIL
jgi:hypothetical protein